MIRKTALISFLLLFICFGLMAEPHVALAPYTGAYGVNMASNKYQGDKHTDDYRWGDGSGQSSFEWNSPSFDNLPAEDSRKYYLDQHMIGVGGVYGLSEDQRKPLTRYEVIATCTNGFYFKSQSNPNIMRPFEILIVARYENSPGEGTTDHVAELDYSGKKATFYYKGLGEHIWFDMVLALPLDENQDPVPGSNYIMADGQRYSLVQADDYTALVTINITAWDHNGNIIDSDTISIPFSGYYDGEIDGKRDDRLSLMFTPNVNAGNLNILTQNSQYIPVGNIDFLLDAKGKNYESDYVKIFFSSSNEPDDATAQDFRFVHSSVEPSTALTNYNSIGYEILVMSEDNTENALFPGSDHLVNDQIENAISPRKVTSLTSKQGNRDYFRYSGQINVFIHAPQTVMLPGDYHDRVYIHVVTDPSKAGS